MAGPTPAGRDPDFDAAWAEITERLGELRLPSSPEEDAEDAPSDIPRPDSEAGGAEDPAEHDDLAGPRDFAPAEPDPDQDAYVPPEPPSLTEGSPPTVLGWWALLLGLAVLIGCAMFWRAAPVVVWLGAVAAALVGAGLLLWQLPGGRSDDTDDGAVL